MSSSSSTPMSIDDLLPPERPLTDMNNNELIDEFRALVGQMKDGLLRAYNKEHNKEKARRCAERVSRAVTILSTRQTGEIIDKQDEIVMLRNEYNALRAEYFDLRDEYLDLSNAFSDLEDQCQLLFDLYIRTRDLNNRQLEQIRNNAIADHHNIRRLQRQIAVLRIQNQWHRFRHINPPPIIHQPQQPDQIWLLLQ